MSKQLSVYIDGILAGSLEQDSYGMIRFGYAPNYSGVKLSVKMPVGDREYSGNRVHAWFDNLLPDNEQVRKSMAERKGIKATTIPLLSHYGLDLPGAVQLVSDETRETFENRKAEKTKLTRDEIGQHLAEMHEAELASQMESGRISDHAWARQDENWSLGGNQAKWALQRIGSDWYSCNGSTPSNVIVKPGVFGMEGQALTECVSMRLAKNIGLSVAEVNMERFGDMEAIVIDRYDRITNGSGSVSRIHQEDLCQAFGVFAEHKYSNEKGPASPAIISFLEEHGNNQDVRNFIDALFYNYAIAAPDAHSKNFSILHVAPDEIKLAPLYDVASGLPYFVPRKNRKPHRLAMSIGGENRVGYLRESSFKDLASISGIDEKTLILRMEEITEKTREQVLPTIAEFNDAEHIDILASRLIPRINALCDQTQKSLNGKWRRQYFEIANVRPEPYQISDAPLILWTYCRPKINS